MKIYDFLIVWWWASGLFSACNLPKNSSKLLLEQNDILGVKVLMSWWERANFTNLYVDESKYVSNNPKAVIGFLHRFTQYDIINFFENKWVSWKVEDNWRVITASGHAKDILNALVKTSKENNTNISTSIKVKDIRKKDDIFEIVTNKWNYFAKNVIVSVWWKSYPQVGTIWFGYKLAEKFWLNVFRPYKWLVWVITKEDVSLFSGTTTFLKLNVYKQDKLIFSQEWNLLFTHWWISGPVVYNMTLYDPDFDIFPDKFKIELEFLEKDGKLQVTKKLKRHFNLSLENNKIYLHIEKLQPWSRAKVTAWWIDTNELTKYLESRKVPGLFFVWEVVDITWHTWWFNLQWAWSSAYCMAEKFNK